MKGFLPLLLLLLSALAARAQPETRNWRFGTGVGLAFPPLGPPVVVAGGPLAFREACSAISDRQGQLFCYTNGVQVCDRANTPMPNGALRFGHLSSSQGALLVPSPRGEQECYLFTLDALENKLANGLRYSVIDLRLRNGLGDVGAVKEVALPLPAGQTLLTEKLTAVPLPNGRDYWIIVHGWENNLFYSFLLSPAGVQALPVVSSVGLVHRSTADAYDNVVGHLRVSPDGRQLAGAQGRAGVELFDFDNATGRVTNARRLALPSVHHYGLEFSPDGRKLYVAGIEGQVGYPIRDVYQFDLASGAAAVKVGTTLSTTGPLLRGPDGRIYIVSFGSASLAVISAPDAAGAACGFLANGLALGTAPTNRDSPYALPNFPGGVAPVRVVLSADGLGSCVGATVGFQAALVPAAAATVFSWDFGDPAAGAANTGVGASVSHVYARAGTYTARVSARLAGGATYEARHTVAVGAPPELDLAPRQRRLCAGERLSIGPVAPGAVPAGTTYRWRDGPTTPTRVVQAAGRYVLTATSPLGCVTKDSVEVQLLPAPFVQLGPDGVLCFGQPALPLRAGPQPAGSTFRWQDGSTQPTFAATAPGRYWLEVRNAAGCTSRDSLQVSDESCPFTIPNIITPNGDRYNAALVLQGLFPATYSLRIFNRWGREVFAQAAYDNSWAAQGQPDGIYYYLLTKTASGRKINGWVEVRR